MSSLNSDELFGVGHANFAVTFHLQNCKQWKTYFFELLLDDLTNLHQTLHVASVDPPDKKYQKNFDSP